MSRKTCGWGLERGWDDRRPRGPCGDPHPWSQEFEAVSSFFWLAQGRGSAFPWSFSGSFSSLVRLTLIKCLVRRGRVALELLVRVWGSVGMLGLLACKPYCSTSWFSLTNGRSPLDEVGDVEWMCESDHQTGLADSVWILSHSWGLHNQHVTLVLIR